MIIQTGARTDIPAFYSKWFMNRMREGYVLVRSPYNPSSITRYSLSRDVVDAIAFCTKNPAPMLPHLDELGAYPQYWYVTITPYGKDLEPHVPEKKDVIEAFRALSGKVGPDRVGWRYDPVVIIGRYTVDYHRRAFERLCMRLEGYTSDCVVSFVDLYGGRTSRNLPGARTVEMGEMLELGEAFADSAAKHGIRVHSCAEGTVLDRFGIDSDGCMPASLWERILGQGLRIPREKGKRSACPCILGSDIGEYNTCRHGCLYCYANQSPEGALENSRLHDPSSPLLTGWPEEGAKIHVADQRSWVDGNLFLV